jgi:hypothetical protein
MLLVAGLMLWLRSLDPMLSVGILRSGGDTCHAAILDVGAIWLAGIPAMTLAAFALGCRCSGYIWPLCLKTCLKIRSACAGFSLGGGSVTWRRSHKIIVKKAYKAPKNVTEAKSLRLYSSCY